MLITAKGGQSEASLENRETHQQHRGVSLRSLLLVALLVPANIYWVVILETTCNSYPTYIVPFYTVIFSLFILTLLNALLRRFLPRAALSQAELLVIYVLLSLATTLCSYNMIENLIPLMSYGFWNATDENRWADLFWKHMPGWLTMSDKDVLKGFYEGDSSFFRMEHLRGWMIPVLSWSGFATVLIFGMFCLSTLFRDQWSKRERLPYPTIELPFQMTNPSGRFLRNRLMWTGFGITALIGVINGLNYLYPQVPYIPVKRFSMSFSERPLDSMGSWDVSFYPFGIGIGFLMPLNIAFSCVFFYFVHKISLMIGAMAGWRALPGFPYPNEQLFGGFVAIAVSALWMSRKHLLHIFRTIGSESREYRLAIIGFLISFCALMAFSYAAGMSLWITPLFYGIYFALSVAVSHVRGKSGFPVHAIRFIGPPYSLITLIGTSKLGARNMTVFSLFQWFNRGYASHPMPHQLEGMKLAERTKMSRRRLSIGMMIIIPIAAVLSFAIILHIYYQLGGTSGRMPWGAVWFGNETFNTLERQLYFPSPPSAANISFMGIGFVFALFLMAMQMRFIWWPFHPLGYAVSATWSITVMWNCFLIGFVAKWIAMRFTGLRGYRKALPFFLGLILGDYMTGSFWSILGIIMNKPTYVFWL